MHPIRNTALQRSAPRIALLTSIAALSGMTFGAGRAAAQEPPPSAPPATTEPPSAPTGEAPPAGEPPAAEAPASAEPPAPAGPPAVAEAPVPAEPPASTEPPPAEAEPPADSGTSPAEEARGTALSDVVVTAQKREEKAQDVPTPITVAGGKRLAEENITSSNEIERISPNLSGQASNGRNSRPRWFLRGIGTNDPSLNLESPIGIYQDEVYVAYVPLQSFPLFDLERVEVLKGPQGTLWGKNTTGGAIHFVSRKPGFDPSGYVKGTFGSYGLHGAEGGFGGPVIGEWLAARASLFYEEQDGWAKNLRDGSNDPEYADFATRIQLLANVGEDLDVLLSARFRVLTGGGAPSYPIGVGPGGAIQQYPMAATTYTPSYGTNPKVKDDFLRGPGASRIQTAGVTATINWHLGEYTLTSISAIDDATNESASYGYWPDLNFDQTGSSAQVDSRQFTQELRVTSPKDDRFNWIAGFHYFNWHLFSDSASAIFGPVATRKNYTDNRLLQDDISYAGFASATFDVTERFAVTVGARYTYDRKEVRAQRLSGNGETLTFLDQGNWFDPSRIGSTLRAVSLDRKKGWSQLTYDVTPEFHVTDDILVFARFAKGFRAGTYNPTILPATTERDAILPSADPEILYDLELGAKTAWLDDRLVANASLFRYWLEDVQLNVQQPNPNGIPGASTSSIQNAAGGRVTGGELELEGLPLPELRLRAGIGVVKAEYTDFITYQGTQTVDASGNEFYRTPQFSGTFGGNFTLPVSEESSVGVGTDWIVRSHIYHNAVVQNDPVQETPGYAIGNAEVRFVTGKGRFTLQGYVKNLTDKSYKVLSQVVNGGAYPTSLGVPRTFGAQFIAQL